MKIKLFMVLFCLLLSACGNSASIDEIGERDFSNFEFYANKQLREDTEKFCKLGSSDGNDFVYKNCKRNRFANGLMESDQTDMFNKETITEKERQKRIRKEIQEQANRLNIKNIEIEF